MRIMVVKKIRVISNFELGGLKIRSTPYTLENRGDKKTVSRSRKKMKNF